MGKISGRFLRSFKPGYYPWFLDDKEIRLFTCIIEQAIHVGTLAKKHNGRIKDKPPDHFFARKYDETSNEWRSVQISVAENEKKRKATEIVNELELRELKKSLKQSNIPLEFDGDYFLSPVQDHPNERPYYPTMILSVERVNGLIVYYEMVKMTEPSETIQSAFYRLLRQLKSIPKELWIKEELVYALKPIAKKLNFELVVVPALPLIDEARKEMEMMLPQHD